VVKGNGAAWTDAEVAAPLALPTGVDPASVRVLDAATGQAVPAQYESATAAGPGTMAWIVPGDLADGAERRFEVIGQRGTGQALAPAGGFWREATHRIVAPGYELELHDGVVAMVHDRLGLEPDDAVWSLAGVSSGQTGWFDENGVLEAFEVLANGPVRTVIRVRRNLAEGVTIYSKTYHFYAGRYEVETSAEPTVTGLYNRIYVLRPATYEDDRGEQASIDGHGDFEPQGGTVDWIAMYSPEWAATAVDLDGPRPLTYWDAGKWGGLGLNGSNKNQRQAFVFHPGQADARYAAADAVRLRHKPTVTW
jgi:hypothetical protein